MNYLGADGLRVLKGWRLPAAVLGVAVSFFAALNTRGYQMGLFSGGMSVYSIFTLSSIGSERLVSLVLCMLPAAMLFCEDMENGYIRYSLIRGNILNYVWSKITVIFIFAVLTMALGGMLFVTVCSIWKPWAEAGEISKSFSPMNKSVFGEFLNQGHYLLYFLCNYLRYGLLAAMLSEWSAYFSLHIRNKGVVLILPLCIYEILREFIMVKWISIYMFTPQNGLFADDHLMGILYPIFLSVLVTAGAGIAIAKKIKKMM